MATYFPRFQFPTMARPRWPNNAPPPVILHPPQQARSKEDDVEPFIPTDTVSELGRRIEEEEAEERARAAGEEEEDSEEEFEREDRPRAAQASLRSQVTRQSQQRQYAAERARTPQPQHVPQYQQQRAPSKQQDLIALKVYKYHPTKREWHHTTLSGNPPSQRSHGRKPPQPKPPCTQLRIITWNVDFVSTRHQERLYEALRHIEEDVLECKDGEAPPPCVICLQEVRDKIVPYLLTIPWVRRWFAVTPFTKDKWPAAAEYGNVTLVHRALDVHQAHILHYGDSRMQRTAVCVKLRLTYPGSQETAVLAVVNTHLESMPDGAPARPRQLEVCSRFLRLEGVEGGVIAGDMNMLYRTEATMGKDLGLRDAWRKGDLDEKGKTWGFQGQNEGGHPTNRLDRIFYLPGMGYRVEEPGRIGMGLKIGDGRDAIWVSDHFGLETTLRMKGRSQSS